MAARFWVGGTGNWDAADTTHWAATSGGAGGETVPTSSDTVTFDSNSGAGATVTITGATANTSSITINKSDLILLHNAGSTVTGTVTLTTGTLNTNGQICSWAGFSSSNSNARSLTLGSSTITISGTGTPWNLDGSNLTLSTGTATVTLTGVDAAMAPCPNSSSWAIGSSIIFTGSGDHQIFVDGGTLGNLTFTGTATKTDKIKFAGAKTIAGTFTINGNSAINRVLVYSSTLGTTRTITAATVTITNADFQDITGAGAGSWDLSAITGGSGDAGGNTGITFTTATTQTWSGTSGGNYSTNAWTTRVPLLQDTASFAVAFSGGQTVTMDMPRIGTQDWSGASGSPTANYTTNYSLYGSNTFISGMTVSGNVAHAFVGRGSYSLTSGGKSFVGTATFNALSANTYTLQDAFAMSGTGTITLTTGGLNTNGFSVTCLIFNSNNSNTRSLTLGTSTINLGSTALTNVWEFSTSSNLTFSGKSSTINISSTSANTRIFSGSVLTYGTLEYDVAGSTGALRILGSNSFAAIVFSDVTNARTLEFAAGTTTTIRSASGWQVNGTSGKLMTVTSSSAATHTITCASGTISSDYLNVSYSIATGGARFFAGANSTDSLNNTGWYFAAPSNGLGGTVSTSGAYTIHTFNSSGTFTATKSFNVDYLVVAGGGGGGGPSGRGGGGGAGGFRTGTAHAVTAQAYSITVGAGGAGSSASGAVGTSGENSVFDTITSTGGGGGGTGPAGASRNGATGGSGGGAGDYSGSGTAGTGTVGQGSDGGVGMEAAPSYGAGGGGGASAVGQAGSSTKGGDGGAGTSSSISGSAVTYAGGGGGAAADAGATYGVGGTGGGGRGASNGAAVAGTANTGGGGGGGNDSGPNNGAAGGSGIVIIRYRAQLSSGSGTLRDMAIQFYQSLTSIDGKLEYLKSVYFKSQTGLNNSIDAEKQYLRSRGAVGYQLDELWNSYLNTRGLSGTLRDKLRIFYQGMSF